jgi:hypothetical protein
MDVMKMQEIDWQISDINSNETLSKCVFTEVEWN